MSDRLTHAPTDRLTSVDGTDGTAPVSRAATAVQSWRAPVSPSSSSPSSSSPLLLLLCSSSSCSLCNADCLPCRPRCTRSPRILLRLLVAETIARTYVRARSPLRSQTATMLMGLAGWLLLTRTSGRTTDERTSKAPHAAESHFLKMLPPTRRRRSFFAPARPPARAPADRPPSPPRAYADLRTRATPSLDV